MEPLTCPSPPNDSQDLNLLAAPGHPSPLLMCRPQCRCLPGTQVWPPPLISGRGAEEGRGEARASLSFPQRQRRPSGMARCPKGLLLFP